MFFKSQNPPVDDLYVTIASSVWPPAIEAREFIESVWPKAEPLLDRDFAEKAARAFSAHFWELYLAAAIQALGLRLVPRAERTGRDAGPDFLIRDLCAIEAVSVTPGNGPDAVPERMPNVVSSVPDEAIQLRLLNALDEKRRKHEHYVSTAALGSEAPFVIAINGRGATSPGQENTVPRIVRALFAIGHLQVHLTADTFEAIGHSYAHQPNVVKSSGASVATDLFISSPRYAGVSAALYSCVDPVNRPKTLGGDFIIVHNPNATNPIPLGSLPCRFEYVLDGDQVRRLDGPLATDV